LVNRIGLTRVSSSSGAGERDIRDTCVGHSGDTMTFLGGGSDNRRCE
jgi:hypothetical protein